MCSKNWINFSDNRRTDVQSIDLIEHLIEFTIGSDLCLKHNQSIPSVKQEFNKNRIRLNVNLEEGFKQAVDNHKLIDNYRHYRTIKWINYLKCLQKYDIIAKEKPSIVSFGGIISKLLSLEESKFFGLKFRGVIYLFGEKTLVISGQSDRNTSLYSYFGLKFLYLITNRNDLDLNEFEKHFNVDSIVIKDTKLIVCNEIDAIDGNQTLIDAKCRQIYKKVYKLETFYKHILMSYWSQCVIRGVNTVIIGNRDDSTLKDIEIMSVKAIPDKCRAYWSDRQYYSYLNQSIDFIKSKVTSDDRLYEFEIKGKTLSCLEQYMSDQSEYFLPKFYTK